jgi:hypothetical protein
LNEPWGKLPDTPISLVIGSLCELCRQRCSR